MAGIVEGVVEPGERRTPRMRRSPRASSARWCSHRAIEAQERQRRRQPSNWGRYSLAFSSQPLAHTSSKTPASQQVLGRTWTKGSAVCRRSNGTSPPGGPAVEAEQRDHPVDVHHQQGSSRRGRPRGGAARGSPGAIGCPYRGWIDRLLLDRPLASRRCCPGAGRSVVSLACTRLGKVICRATTQ